MTTILEYERERKLELLESNYQSKKSKMTRASGETYIIKVDNIQDIIGLITLNQDSNLGVIHSDGTFTLVMHTVAELTTLLDDIRVYLTGVKTSRFGKKMQLLQAVDLTDISNIDITL